MTGCNIGTQVHFKAAPPAPKVTISIENDSSLPQTFSVKYSDQTLTETLAAGQTYSSPESGDAQFSCAINQPDGSTATYFYLLRMANHTNFAQTRAR